MALDIEPLSPARRAVMLVVMLALLGAALAFAQVLVTTRSGQRRDASADAAPVFRVAVNAIEGMTKPVPEWERLDGVVLTGSGQFGSAARRFAVFSYQAEVPPGGQIGEAQDILKTIMGGNIEQSAADTSGIIAGFPAVQVMGRAGKGPEEVFAVVRVLTLPNHVVAICYSGNGTFTDFQYFDMFCRQGVSIRQESPANPK
jgi:hypothetical protein